MLVLGRGLGARGALVGRAINGHALGIIGIVWGLVFWAVLGFMVLEVMRQLRGRSAVPVNLPFQ